MIATNNDRQIIHHLWLLNKYTNEHFRGREHKDIIFEDLNEDICIELDLLVAHIKENY